MGLETKNIFYDNITPREGPVSTILTRVLKVDDVNSSNKGSTLGPSILENHFDKRILLEDLKSNQKYTLEFQTSRNKDLFPIGENEYLVLKGPLLKGYAREIKKVSFNNSLQALKWFEKSSGK
jgi:hypothetical protein